jgi:hypothetical protein
VKARGLVAIPTLLVAFIAAVLPASSASADVSTTFLNSSSVLCMTSRAGNGERPVVQTTCDTTVPTFWADQHWLVVGGNALTQIKNVATGLCLVARGSGEAQAVATGCGPAADQWWWPVYHYPTGTYKLQNKNSGLCLAARGYGESPVIATTCDSSVNRYWPDQHWYES